MLLQRARRAAAADAVSRSMLSATRGRSIADQARAQVLGREPVDRAGDVVDR